MKGVQTLYPLMTRCDQYLPQLYRTYYVQKTLNATPFPYDLHNSLHWTLYTPPPHGLRGPFLGPFRLVGEAPCVLSTLILAARPADRVVGLSEFEARYVALEVASGAVGGMDLSRELFPFTLL